MTHSEAERRAIEAVRRVKANADKTTYRDQTGFRINATPMWADLEDALDALDALPRRRRVATR